VQLCLLLLVASLPRVSVVLEYACMVWDTNLCLHVFRTLMLTQAKTCNWSALSSMPRGTCVALCQHSPMFLVLKCECSILLEWFHACSPLAGLCA
jgi:hypothetical protein